MADRGPRQGSTTTLWQNTGLVVLAAVTIVLCFFAVTRDPDAGASAGASPSETASTSVETPDTLETPSAAPSSEAPPAEDPPKVADLRDADFETGADLPEGARTFDNPAVGSPLALVDGGLTHDAPTGREALSSLEVRLATPVQKLSARVRFPAQDPGSVVLVAWQNSLVEARAGGRPVPLSGLRLVASNGSWKLTTYDRTPEVIGTGTYEATGGPATFTVYRQDDTAWVEDPAGTVAQVQDPRIESLAGPWASWQLYEKTGQETPAVIEAISAG